MDRTPSEVFRSGSAGSDTAHDDMTDAGINTTISIDDITVVTCSPQHSQEQVRGGGSGSGSGGGVGPDGDVSWCILDTHPASATVKLVRAGAHTCV